MHGRNGQNRQNGFFLKGEGREEKLKAESRKQKLNASGWQAGLEAETGGKAIVGGMMGPLTLTL